MPDPTAGERDLDRLRLVAMAVAARSLDVGAAAPGEPAWTDGAIVFVDPSADRTEQVRTLCVQASLLAAGSLRADVVGPLARRPALTRRYLAIEGHRALAANDDLLPRAVRSLVDPDVARRTTSPEESLALARRSAPGPGEPPPCFGAIHPRRMRAAAEQDAPGQATRVAPGLARRPVGEPPLDELEDGEDETVADLGSLVSSPVGGGGPVGRLLRRLLLRPARALGGGPPGADAPTHAAHAAPGPGRRAALAGGPAGTLDEAPTTAEPAASTYPEWDVHRRRYRPGWCVVVEGDPPGTPETPPTLPDRPALRAPLARLGLGLTRCRRQPQGDDIDLDAAVEARVDALAGAPLHDDVYLDSLRRRRDLAVLVLLDVSGSASEPAAGGGRTVHEHQRVIAAALTGALHALGDRVALYAFNSRGRTAVHVMRIKAFDDVLDGRVARRLDSVAPAAYTRLGAAIRHGTALLEARGGTPRRLLVVLSDGFAYDHGYDGRYGEADARRALLEARRRGVGCLCLSVGADTEPAALRRVFGAAAHAAVSRADELPSLIGPLFRSALRSAEAQRRSFQRARRTQDRLASERRPDGHDAPAVLRPGR